jgi:hypothetical protein
MLQTFQCSQRRMFRRIVQNAVGRDKPGTTDPPRCANIALRLICDYAISRPSAPRSNASLYSVIVLNKLHNE